MVSSSSPEGSIYSILDLTAQGTQAGERKPGNAGAAGQDWNGMQAGAMTKRKPGKFSATKAVKANARERVGQPKPARVVDTEPRTGREVKHKPKLEEIIQREE
jgi:hypothetical protein